MQALVGADIFDGDSIRKDAAVLISDEQIAGIVPSGDVPDGAEIVELPPGLVAPGFIDTQINGGGGALFNTDPSVETLIQIADAHRRSGTTGMLPTVISDRWQTMQSAADAVKSARQNNMPNILGIHFEGPYLNPAKKGVHDEHQIRAVDEGAMDLFTDQGLGRVVVTLAPERTGTGIISELAAAGVRVSAGHTAASYQETKDALTAGLSSFTHLFNAMPAMESRRPGVIGAALECEESWCGLILDGHHVHPATVKVAVKAKARGKMMLVTDAMPSVGAADKSFKLYGQDIIVRDGKCVTADGILAGSDLNMAAAVLNARDLAGIDLAEALRMASLYPAGFLGLDDRLGRIAPGYRADLVHMGPDLQVQRTWVAGGMEIHA